MGIETSTVIISPVKLDENWLKEVIESQRHPLYGWNSIDGGEIEHLEIKGRHVYRCEMRKQRWQFVMDDAPKGFFPKNAIIMEWVDGDPTELYFWDDDKGRVDVKELYKVLYIIPDDVQNDESALLEFYAIQLFYYVNLMR